MGLLSRAVDSQSNFHLENKKKTLIDSFFSDAKKLQSGFKYSGKLFELFCRDLNITKGALLILEKESDIFLPASSLNADMTTLRHLRIESKILENQFHYYYDILTKNDNKIKLFKQYFSIREFSALDSLMLVPFYLNGILNAILLIVDPGNKIVDIVREISLNSEKIISKLLKSRNPFSNVTSEDKEEISTNPVIILQEFLDKDTSKDFSLLVVKMELKQLINAIIRLLPDTDSYEITNDIIRSIKRLISNFGRLVKFSSEKYLLFYKIKTGTTPGLILHQINLAISSFFNLTGNLPDIDAEMKLFQSDQGGSAESILEGFI